MLFGRNVRWRLYRGAAFSGLNHKNVVGRYRWASSLMDGEKMNISIIASSHSAVSSPYSSFIAFSGARFLTMNIGITFKVTCQVLVLGLVVLMSPLVAAEEMPRSLQLSLPDQGSGEGEPYKFKEAVLGGFERSRRINGLKVHGWQVADNFYLGHTKVDKKWGFGFVYMNGAAVWYIVPTTTASR